MNRNVYLEKLIRKKHNGMIKVITGIRRCGKSYLLFNLFNNYLIREGVKEDHIIKLALDDRANAQYRDPDKLCDYVHSMILDKDMYYILLDEVQFVNEFEDVLNSFLHIENADTYVTGSNAKFLSKDIITEFRGRGDQIHLFPLSFSEFMQDNPMEMEQAWQDYLLFGGLPQILGMKSKRDKQDFLKDLFSQVYVKDILERNDVRNPDEMEELLSYLASAVGGLTNQKKLSDTFKSVKGKSIHPETIKNYLDLFEDSFLISKANRYDIKGRKYISTPAKYYFVDTGLRNACLNFRQYEESHLMENVIYNELLIRGYSVDVGVVDYNYYSDDQRIYKKLEIDFVCNLGSNRIYIQSALAMSNEDKEKQEQLSLQNVDDNFKKMIIVKDIPTHFNQNGILIYNLFDFLTDSEALDR